MNDPDKKESRIKEVKSLLSMLQFYRWSIPTIVILGVISGLAEGTGISLLIPFIQSAGDSLIRADESWLTMTLNGLFTGKNVEQRPWIIPLFILAFITFKALISLVNIRLTESIQSKILHRLHTTLFNKLLSVKPSFTERHSVGEITSIISDDTSDVSDAISYLLSFITHICIATVFVALLILISWQLSIIVVLSLMFISTTLYLFNRRLRIYSRQVVQANSRLNERLIESLQAMRQIRVFGQTSHERRKFSQASEELCGALFRAGANQQATAPIFELLTASVLVTILLASMAIGLDLAESLVFLAALFRLQGTVRTINVLHAQLTANSAAVNRVTSFTAGTSQTDVDSGFRSFECLDTGILFEDVTFHYEGGRKPAIHGVSFEIPRGKTTALIGPSGAGKSTILSLILRLYDVTSGKISANNFDLRELSLSTWYEHISLVDQDVFLFNASVRDNIAYGKPDASDDEIVAAAGQAQAHGFVVALPQGYDTVVGNRGYRLSGGEKQRITMARAIIRDPEVLILDEATNALDSASEHLMHQALNRIRKHRTTIIIAHRLSTIENSDQIIVLDHGQVYEKGTFPQLLRNNGLFKRLYELQKFTSHIDDTN